jgi:predicted secreted protein
MEWTSIVAIFVLFWVLSAFLVMPFGMRTVEEDDVERVPGQVDSAPAQFRPGCLPCIMRTTSMAGSASKT